MPAMWQRLDEADSWPTRSVPGLQAAKLGHAIAGRRAASEEEGRSQESGEEKARHQVRTIGERGNERREGVYVGSDLRHAA